uniref:Uncharacterized protein n=1 Tax=Knipowitschia caucasica TaxID=637954 RepID=A0AAV2M8I8_KNICA
MEDLELMDEGRQALVELYPPPLTSLTHLDSLLTGQDSRSTSDWQHSSHALMMLDLTAAFDPVDQSVHLSRLASILVFRHGPAVVQVYQLNELV